MFHRTACVTEHIALADRTYRIRLNCPDIAAAIRPGQFIMSAGTLNHRPALRRPFALYDTVLDDFGRPIGFDIVYLVVGKMTGRLVEVSVGESLQLWGPLGKPFLDVGNPEWCVTLVAGGIGQTPFLAYARELLGTRGYGGDLPRKRTGKVSLYYGVRTSSLAAGVEDFRTAGVKVFLTSDDGSTGTKGFVTQLLISHGRTGPLPSAVKPGADAPRSREDRSRMGGTVSGFARNSNGLRRWDLLQLRDEGHHTGRMGL